MPTLSGQLELETAPVRVLHLVSTFAIKTDTKWLFQLLGRLPADRFDSRIGCVYGGGPMRGRFAGLGLKTFDLDAPRVLSPTGLWRLSREIRRFRPHVLHTHLLRADLYGGLAGRLLGVPAILSTQYAVHPFARVTRRSCDPQLDGLCRRLATDALAVSEAVRRDLVDRVGWPATRVHTIHTGLDFAGWMVDPGARARRRAAWGIPADATVVVTVARLDREKGLDVLVDAAGIVHRSSPGVRFVVVGQGVLSDTLRRQIALLGLERTVLLAGFSPDIPSVLAAADCFVLPSYMEGMPNAVLEACAAGLPVIASDVGGLPEIIEHERTGLLVEAGNAAALAAALARMIGDMPAAARMAAAAAESARRRFSIELAAAQYASLYERLAGGEPAGRWSAWPTQRMEGRPA